MAIAALPAIDAAACSGWTPQQIDLYNKLPAWFFTREVSYRKKYGNWKRIFGSMDWEPNKGTTMTGIISEPPPTRRQFAFPAVLSTTAAKKDIVQHRERTYTVSLVHHKFESPVFQWLSSFQDFVKKKIAVNLDYVMKWQEEFQSTYYRGQVFHQAPAIAFAGHSTTPVDDTAPTGTGNAAGTSGKTNAYLQAMIAGMSPTDSTLSIKNLFRFLSALEEDLLAVPYQSGSAKDDSYLNDKFLLMTSSEAWNQFINDPWTKENRKLDLDIVTEGFKGSLMGRITASLHSNPIRILKAADGSISFPAPEVIQENTSAENFGQTVRNPDYKNAQYEVAFLCGANGYDIVNPGAPPGDFASKAGLAWNGRPMLTDQIISPCTNPDDSSTVWEPNRYGEYLQIISMLVLGIAGVVKRNVLPIVFERSRTLTTSLV